MKTLALLIGPSLVSAPAFAQTITVNEAPAHVGQTFTVKGIVDEVHTSGKGNIFLDLGGRYPNQEFTGVIFSQYAGVFPNATSLEGKTVNRRCARRRRRAADEIEGHRAQLREAGTGFKALPPLVLHGAKALVERASAELERAWLMN